MENGIAIMEIQYTITESFHMLYFFFGVYAMYIPKTSDSITRDIDRKSLMNPL